MFFSSLQGLVAEDMRRRISAHGSVIRIYLEPFDDPCIDWKFGLVLGGLVPSKIEVIWVIYIYIDIFDICIYIYIYVYIFGSHLWGSGIGWIPARNVQSCLALRSMPPMLLAGKGEGFRGNCFLMVSNFFNFHPKPWGNDPI